ncbi:glycosyl transferase family 2 [Oscillatoriales cyanobacterium USR001]|nr:glycosyl transferase family 2 [Oscillatoriales cyanobacterium USR001]
MNLNLGINISGYINGEFGVGEGARANIRAIEAANIPLAINNFTKSVHRKQDGSYQNFSQDNPYPVNLIQVNADETNNFIKYIGKNYLKNRYNIGFWAWELPIFPPDFESAFNFFDEIWTYSNYCAESISMASPIPVIKMMPSISLPAPSLSRENLGLPKEKFIFLFIFDFYSIFERKNPLAAIAAFKQAFGDSNPEVLLVIKSCNSDKFPKQQKLLNYAIENCQSIQHIDGYLSKNELNSLINNCDCYLSLHRCEGFGLTMAEAMFLGKPVIATAYSSNTEFMNVGNSFLVKYQLTELTADFGPYKKGNFWANPDIEHAAYLMQYAFNHREQTQQIGARGGEEIKALLNPQVMGNKIRKRLEYIGKITNNFTGLSRSRIAQVKSQQIGEKHQLSSQINQKISQPLVSICIPTYNGEEFIAEALESAFAQTYSNIEVIVSDDGSSDRTVDIAKSFQSKTSVDFRIILHRNYGLAQNWNFCIAEAKGEYIKFLFQDDLMEPDCIEKMIDLAQKDTGIGMVFSPRGIVIGEAAKSNPLFLGASQSIKDLHKSWSNLKPIQRGIELLSDPHWMQNPINKIGEPSTVMIAADVFRNIGLFDAELSQYLDLDMWFRIMGNYKIGFIDRRLSSLRIHAGQQTWKNFAAGENNKDVRRLYQKMISSDAYSFLNEELKDKVRQKLGLKPQLSLSELSKTVEQYRKSPTNQSTLNSLRQNRYRIAQKCLNLPESQLESAYHGELGKAHKMILESGIKNEALTEEEQQFLQKIAANFSEGSDLMNMLNSYLSLMLYSEAYALPVNYKNAAIPQWFFKDFLSFIFHIPSGFQQIGATQRYAEYMQDLIKYVHDNIFNYQVSDLWRYIAAFASQNLNLTPLYCSNFNLGNIMAWRGDIIEFTLKNLGNQIDWEFSEKKADSHKIRLGILLQEISDRKTTWAMIPAFEYLDRTKFEIILYNSKIENSKLGNYCQKLADKQIQLPADLSSQVETIRADDLDILMIATDWNHPLKSSVLLSLHRLARVQVAVGTSVTTGIRNIDYLITGNLSLPGLEAASEYREKLITVDGSGICLSYPITAEIVKVHPTRSSWGVANDGIVFMSGARAIKIVPELMETWAKILSSVPNSILVLHPFRLDSEVYQMTVFFNQIREIFAKKGVDKKRVVVIKCLPNRVDFRECLRLADVYLDSFPWVGVASIVEPLLVGLPTVVREGQTVRSRQSGAILRELQLPELVAETEKAYVEIGVVLGTNPAWRDRYRQQIQQKIAQNPKILESRAYSAHIQPLFEQICGQLKKVKES